MALAVGALYLLVFAPLALAASDVEVEATRNGELIEVRARATIQAALVVVWSTLTDYEHLPEFIPGLKKSRVISRVGATTIVEQSGEARFLFMSIPVEITLESIERPPNIDVRRIAGTVRYLQGRYETEVSGTDPLQVQLRWRGAIAPEADLPPLIGEALMRLSIEQQFIAMVNEIERRETVRQNGLAPGASSPSQAASRASLPPPAVRPQEPPGSSR
jgi:ribosome-associated toxin RatA of RatAB toxin-antitoxin module